MDLLLFQYHIYADGFPLAKQLEEEWEFIFYIGAGLVSFEMSADRGSQGNSCNSQRVTYL
jgi:hypothetical protein